MGVVESVQGDIDRLAERMPLVAECAEAALALALASEIDASRNSATSKSMCARALSETMKDLRAMVPPEEKKGALHGIKSGRALRLVEGEPGA